MMDNVINYGTNYDFYKAVFLIESQLKGKQTAYNEVGHDSLPKQELIKFCATQNLAYPGNAISNIDVIESKYGMQRVNVQVSFMGLTGCSGALPSFYTELVLHRIKQKDTAMRDFYDLFNHRLISLYYRAWKKYKHAINFNSSPDRFDPHTQLLSQLAGGSQQHQLFFAGLYRNKIKNVSDLKAILSYYSGCDVNVKQLVGAWRSLEQSEQSRLAKKGLPFGQHARLGVDAMAGSQIWDINSGIEIELKTDDAKIAKSLLPNGKLHLIVKNIIKDYVGSGFQSTMKLITNSANLDTSTLSKSHTQLGISGLLKIAEQRHKTITLSFKGN